MWQIPNHKLTLADDRVHIWRARLDLSTDKIAEFASILSEDETLRANRFRFPQHRRQFIAARGILRRLLASYLSSDNDRNLASRLKFEYGTRGKPRLSPTSAGSDLEFNLSHSQDLAVYGFTRHHLIGIDIEYLRSMKDMCKIARRFFSEREAQLIASLDESRQKLAFFQIWTAKEAYLKATGEGLAGSLDSVEISLENQNSISLISTNQKFQTTLDWSITPFTPAVDTIGAIAIQNNQTKQQIKFWNWN